MQTKLPTKNWRLYLLATGMSLAAACGDSKQEPLPDTGHADAGADASDAASDASTVTCPSGSALQLTGLQGRVEVNVDDRGIPHIYGTTMHDVVMVEGYLMAKDRLAQMEFIRRGVTGRLSEVLSSVQPSLVNQDKGARLAGYARMGRRIYESLAPNDTSRIAAEAYVSGVNQFIDEVIADCNDPTPMTADAMRFVVAFMKSNPSLAHWEPSDVFSLARYQAASLSFDADSDIGLTATYRGFATAFAPNAANPAMAARTGMFADLYASAPARESYTREGFPAASGPSNPNPAPSPAAAPSLGAFMRSLPADLLSQGQAAANRIEALHAVLGDAFRGSNNWVVAGSKASGGSPILANDPHLELMSPPVWWYVHLNTTKLGGTDNIDAEGVTFAGLPGVVLGFNSKIAWGATTTGYDVTDVYLETLTTDANGVPVSVLFNGAQVPVTVVDESVRLADGTMATNPVYMVPHHGPIVATSATNPDLGAGKALSVRYTGFDISNELAYFIGLLTAQNVAEANAAQSNFKVGSQNFVVIDRENISWNSYARVPLRAAAARSLQVSENGVVSGFWPNMILDGTGTMEWGGDVPANRMPADLNPARGYIATANQDNVGVTADGNPCNDEFYIGGDFDPGHRQHRILQRLDELAERGSITTDDMVALQAETKSELGEEMRDAVVGLLATPLTAVPSLTVAQQAALLDAQTRLAAWTFATPHGVGATAAGEISDSVATSIFNVFLTRVIPMAFGDEFMAATGSRSGSTARSITLLGKTLTERESGLYTYDSERGESVLWDDLSTENVIETKKQIVIRAMVEALEILSRRLGADVNEWRWGRLHTVRFESIVPTGETDLVSIPANNNPLYPNGYPRHGDYGAVDVGNFGVWDTATTAMSNHSFKHGSGASQRLVVQMTAAGPRAFNALPGGQSGMPGNPHHDDEAAHWIANEQPPLAFTQAEVTAATQTTYTFTAR